MAGEPAITRRQALQGAAAAATTAGFGVALAPLEQAAAAADGGERPIRMAMHVHASFSEGSGSMHAHLAEAERVGVDVIWWTEHDHRMVAQSYVTDVHFTGPTEWSNGASLKWRSSFAGRLSSSSASFVSSPASPNDPGNHAFRLSALSSVAAGGTRTVTADAKNHALSTSIDGTTVTVDVRPVDSGVDAWFDIVVETSYRPATAGRPAGQYQIRYRVGGTRPAGTLVEDAPLQGLCVLAAPGSSWTTLTLDPVTDLTELWPDVDFRDAALTSFAFAVTSRNGAPSTTVVDGLHFTRIRKQPRSVMTVQRSLIDHYAPLYPTVVQQQGLELSHSTPHLNWFGNPEIWPASDPAHSDTELAIEKVHQSGGVVSYNHPFGSGGGGLLSQAVRTSKRRSTTSMMVSERAFGADIVEVGFTGGRAGMAQDDYLAMWDVMSRNLVFVTGTGTTDDHRGVSWTNQKWRHVTGVWAQSTDVPDLQTSLRAGRAWFYDPSAFDGTVDLLGAGFVPMGSVGVVTTNRSTLVVATTGVPAGWSIVVVSGAADQAGSGDLDPQVTTRTLPASDVNDGILSLQVRSAGPRFHRVMLADAGGEVRAYSNPLWLLRSLPGVPVPGERLAAAAGRAGAAFRKRR